MQRHKNLITLSLSLVALLFLVNPCQALADKTLEIFYSNDLNGNTEPCG
jgi:hypothetical protein